MKVGVVIPAAENRKKNTKFVFDCLKESLVPPDQVIIICDGWHDFDFADSIIFNRGSVCKVTVQETEKYVPDGKHHQPRNIGVKQLDPDIDYVWFLDSDCIPSTDALYEYRKSLREYGSRILIGPYDWLPRGKRVPDHDLYNDPRWAMFREFDDSHIAISELNFSLANFSGNLVWPVEDFKRVGGFWNEINMGRCEDGELGLRAGAMGIPMSAVREARAWHLDHPINMDWILSANSRDVPKLNARHPWVEQKGIIVADKDGKRFDIVCPSCGKQINTSEIWEHPCQIT